MNHSTPSLPVHHQLPEFTQTHVHRVGDTTAICKASSDNHFTFLPFFFFGMVLLTASCIIVQTSVRSYSGTLFTRSNHLNLFITSTTYSSPPLHIHQFSSVVQSCLTLCNPMDYSTPGFPVHHQLLELAQTHVHQVSDVSNHLILCHPLLLLPSLFPSIRVFSNESALCIRWPKYWSFGFSVSSSNEYSGLISFRIGWLDLAVQGTLKSLLQHHG